jgi:TetR/AcrR family transcriptional regulator
MGENDPGALGDGYVRDRDGVGGRPGQADLPKGLGDAPGQESGEETDRRQQIVDAAFDEFADHGFRGATIKRIAQRAKLRSQALIYWYFPAKEALFEAVLGQQLPILRMVLDPAPLLDRPPEEVLPQLARAYLAAGDRPGAPRLVRLLFPELIRRPEIADAVGGPLIAKILDFIKTYLAHQVELGRLRPHDVRASARAFVGMILPQLGGKLFLPALRADGLTDEEHIATVVAIFLRGLQPL